MRYASPEEKQEAQRRARLRRFIPEGAPTTNPSLPKTAAVLRRKAREANERARFLAPSTPAAALRMIALTTYRAMDNDDYDTFAGAPDGALIGEHGALTIILGDEWARFYAIREDGVILEWAFELRD